MWECGVDPGPREPRGLDPFQLEFWHVSDSVFSRLLFETQRTSKSTEESSTLDPGGNRGGGSLKKCPKMLLGDTRKLLLFELSRLAMQSHNCEHLVSLFSLH